MKIVKTALAAILAIAFALPAMAQGSTSTMTPYSKYGYGILGDNATGTQRAMGGVGYAMQNGRQINAKNPASYVAMDSLTFLWDIGLDLTTVWAKEPGGSSKSTGGGLDYITMQFPITKYLAGSAGLMPYTSVGYSFGSDITYGAEARTGTGGINQLYLGLSGQPLKGFSVGANVYYLFGNLVNDIYVTTDASDVTLFERVMQVRDWNATFGMQYNLKFNKKHQATVGAVFTPGKSVHGTTFGVYYDVVNDENLPDTVGYGKMKNGYSMPETYGAGISYTYDNRFNFELDYTYQPWSKAKFGKIENFEDSRLVDRWKLGFGTQIVPSLRGGYLGRINYRFGAYYSHDYITIDTNNMREWGLTLGFGLPAPGSKTVFNIGFEYKRRYTAPVKLVTEDYFNLTLSVNFNEMWFWKNKIN